jgi:hypothetical protein
MRSLQHLRINSTIASSSLQRAADKPASGWPLRHKQAPVGDRQVRVGNCSV